MDVNVRTRLAVAAAARDTSDLARAIVDATADDRVGDTSLIGSVRLLRVHALMVLDRAVLAERAAGATWAEIAAQMFLPEEEVVRRYADTYRMWETTHGAMGMPAVASDPTAALADDSDPEGLALALDQWRARHSDPWDTPSGRALSELLTG